MRDAAESAVNGVELELWLTRNSSNRGVVISGVVKDKVTDSVSSNLKGLQRCHYYLSHPLARVGACDAIGRSCSVPSAAT